MHKVHQYDTDHYEPLADYISLEGFSYGRNYRMDETKILQPRLEALGYTNVGWLPGESDDFGPLTRVCKADKDGKTIWFIYG